MKFKGRARSTNVEDRRGGGGGRGKAIGGLGIGGIVVLVIYVLLGGDPEGLIDQGLCKAAPVPKIMSQAQQKRSWQNLSW